MAKKSTETLVGVFVLLGIIALAFLALKAANLASFNTTKTYTVRARFDNIGGLKKNAPVRSAGVSVGQVTSITLDKNTYQGLVTMKLNEGVQFPVDSSAQILTAGLLGVGVVLIVGNTIRLDILNRRAEIEVMKLVGASDGFTRRPFLYSGIWYGLGGGLMALILVALAAAVLARPVDTLAKAYGSQFHLKGLGFTTAAGVLALAAPVPELFAAQPARAAARIAVTPAA